MNDVLVTLVGTAVTVLFGAMALFPFFVNPKAQVQHTVREDRVLSIRPVELGPAPHPSTPAVRPLIAPRQDHDLPREAA